MRVFIGIISSFRPRSVFRNDPEKIFDAFVTTKEKGRGIGLSVSRSIVEAHGGRLWAENGAAGGARFKCSPTALSDE
jgi:C4-dicarboxylate-specific signal transduction histidine kinase